MVRPLIITLLICNRPISVPDEYVLMFLLKIPLVHCTESLKHDDNETFRL